MKLGIVTIICLGLLVVSTFAQDLVSTLAGQPLLAGATNATGTNALFNGPAALASDAVGNIFVADSDNHIIRKIDTNGLVTTYAGQAGVSGTANGVGALARFNNPSGLALDTSGNLFVSDTGNHTIRKITPARSVTTIAGTAGQSGIANGTGAAAQFHSPLGIVVGSNSTLYVADSGNHTIRAISASAVVTTFAGLAETWGALDAKDTNARFNGPLGLAFNKLGELFVSDSNNHTIRKIKPDGTVSTWVGLSGADGCVNGDRTNARFCKPAEMVFDPRGNLYVADSFNNVVRKISANGMVSIVSGAPGILGTIDGANGAARFFNPYGLALRPNGTLIATDAYNELIRAILVPFQLSLQPIAPHSQLLTWETVSGRRYQVQCRSASALPWTNLSVQLLANENTLSFTNNTPSNSKLFRVLLIP